MPLGRTLDATDGPVEQTQGTIAASVIVDPRKIDGDRKSASERCAIPQPNSPAVG
jgi:hypothetical protein